MHPQPSISTLLPYTTLFRSPKPNKNGPFTVPNQQFEAESAIGGPSFASCLPGARPSFPRRRAGIVGLHARTQVTRRDRKSTRLNSSHITNSYAVLCLEKKIS